MTKLYKIKFLKDTEKCKVGEIVNCSKKSADDAVNNGYAEHVVDEPKPKKIKASIDSKIKKIEDSPVLTEDNIIDLQKVREKLKLLIDKDEIDQEIGVNEISRTSKMTKGTLTKQLIKYKEELRVNDAQSKNVTLDDLGSRIGMALDKKALAEHIIDKQPVYYDSARNWWIWDYAHTKWVRTDETDILNAIEKQATINTINQKEKNEMIEALKQVSRLNKPMPISSNWIQFRDTVFDIETGERKKADRWWFVTNPIPWELNEDDFEATPTMDRIFEEWVGKENVKKLYEIIAYCMIPDYPINRIFCFIGSGMNGKSKYLELLRRFIGTSNCCSTELDTLCTSRFEVTRLHKKLVCQMGETNFNEMNKTSMLKKLSGGDLIGFEYKGKDPFEDINYAKLIIATNNLPTTTDKTIGFYRRWMIIDFPNQFSEAKDILAEIPEEEYKSLALKCCNILKELLSKRAFDNEGSVEERMEKYESKSNFLEKFVKTYTEADPNGQITSGEFFKRFQEWCKENRHRDMSETSVGMGMKKMGIEQERTFFSWMYDGKGGTARCWVGIKWK
jgi:P4 family phage/plasmid primase-like protien